MAVTYLQPNLVSLVIEPITVNMGGHSIESTGDMLSMITDLNKFGEIEEMITKDPVVDNVNKINNEYVSAVQDENVVRRIDLLRHSNLRGTSIPDIKKRLQAIGLLDKINPRGCAIPLPARIETLSEPKTTRSRKDGKTCCT